MKNLFLSSELTFTISSTFILYPVKLVLRLYCSFIKCIIPYVMFIISAIAVSIYTCPIDMKSQVFRSAFPLRFIQCRFDFILLAYVQSGLIDNIHSPIYARLFYCA